MPLEDTLLEPCSATVPSRRHGRWAIAAGVVTALMAPGAIAAPAVAAAGHRGTGKRAVLMVEEATRPPFGTILVTRSGAALYRYAPDTADHPTCTGACAAAWPPLLLPSGATTVKGGRGVVGLGTVRTANGRLQVTYRHIPLYTFVSDTGTMVTGQGVQDFSVVHPTRAGASHSNAASTAGPPRSTGHPSAGSPTSMPAGSSGSGYGY
ncbi:MAG TPA: hypothetical protein VKV36_07275 [Acidimicrobiales bacterium]|nr:hypothetical protein [Acidimicrobiales bacterium]